MRRRRRQSRICGRCRAQWRTIVAESFKEFLNRCSKGPEIEESVAAANRTILKEYLEAQTRNAGKEDEDAEKESTVFGDIVQIWSYANQNNSMSSLSMVPTTMTILVRLCSYHDEFKTYGTTLIRTLLRPTTLKIVYRGLTGNKDHIVSPCLRLLTEMNRFNFGAMCGAVHSAFDFTVKDLPRNLEVKGLTKPTVEDPARPSVRTVYLRFILSFLLNGEPSVRNEVLGLRSWTTPIFKHLKTDSAVILHEFLECMTMKVLDEKEIPRATKTNFFNEWTLSHILSLYSREETVMVSKAGKEEEKKVADIAHEFLLNACTKSGAGICFPDHGWYPPGHSDGEEKKKNAPKVHNRILSSLLASIRPYADTMQLDLALGICKTCPELVADHFLSNPTFSFEPKLTSTWIGYCTFLVSVITIPIPENFGAPMALALPPPTSVIVENIIPKPLDKTGLTKCLTNENGLIRFFAIRLLIAAFQKLRSVLDALDTASSAVHDPTESWKKCRFDVVEEFCRRIPDASIVSSIGSGKSDSQGLLQIEAKTRLLADYYTTLPEIASSGRFDINIALGYFLENEDSNQKGMKLLEMGHLLKIANEVPDVKWWNKTSTMKHSPFVAILKRCCSSAANAPQRQVLALLHSFASSSYLFQAETSASPLDALLESLSTIANSENLGAILSFLDEVVARCIRGPFKYLDDYAEIAAGLQNNTSEAAKLSPVSPIVMTLVEQWKFFIQSKDYSSQQKAGGLRWLLRLMESCAILGENRFVLAVLCDRVLDDSGTMKEGIRELKDYLLQDSGLELTSDDDMQEDGVAVGIRDLLTKLRKRCVDVRIAPLLIESVRHRRIEATVFDVTVVQRAIVDIVKCSSNNSADAVSAIIKLTELTKYMTFQLISQGNKSVEKTKAFIAKESPCLHAFLTTPVTAGKLPEIAALSHGYAELLSVIFEKDDPILESARQLLSGRLVTFIRELSSLSEENLPKVKHYL
ncbi:ribosome 60S biogenesis N-terminal-domain-containing protein [Sphaerosporella brunnea]|uniref:Ribosome 60S biogenesis N-terminal-domain-containing protein n=1 Tax=Sphaerosporella brunnea TaxID=1250544 RepID=A0A5J5F0G3_9PEZI|nr:ribosome 60S biogenesis N-terminal-domain-containing protein [Sphaerosporella brunnea]